jgi:hypothetical protein
VARTYTSEVSSDTVTGEVVALASGKQLWRLNELGLLGKAPEGEARVSADRASELLWDAAARGLWEPRPRRIRARRDGRKTWARPRYQPNG